MSDDPLKRLNASLADAMRICGKLMEIVNRKPAEPKDICSECGGELLSFDMGPALVGFACQNPDCGVRQDRRWAMPAPSERQ